MVSSRQNRHKSTELDAIDAHSVSTELDAHKLAMMCLWLTLHVVLLL